LYIDVVGDTVVEKTFIDCKYVLFDVLYGINLDGWTHVKFNTDVVYCLCIYNSALRATTCYVSLTNDLRTMGKHAMLRMSRIQFGPNLFPFGKVDNSIVMSHVLHITTESIKHYEITCQRGPKPEHKALFNEVYNKQLFLDNAKISARHMRHMTINELRDIDIKIIEERCAFMYEWMYNMISRQLMSESALIGYILWVLGMPDEHYTLISRSALWLWSYDSLEDFAKTVKKEISLKLKAVQNLCGIDCSIFFEFEVLVNRGIGAVSWETEKEHRINPNTVTISDIEILERAHELFKKVKKRGGRPFKSHFDTYFKMRWQWAPPGAYHSQYAEDQQYVSSDPMLKNKLYACCAMPRKELEFFTSRTPQIVARASTKYEWGKQRAIYSVDNTNFILSSFAMNGCEEALATIVPIAQEAEATRVGATVREVLKNGVPYCFDFEDFNAQHSTSAMQQVLKAYGKVFETDLSPQQLEALGWVTKSLEDVVIQDRYNGSYRAQGTLLSGWRLTTFMNTVLNVIYTQVMTEQDPFPTTHSGDDILGAVTTLKQTQNIEKNAQIYNIRFQSSKCYLGSIAEFLRVDHNIGDGSQYLARSIATLVHGPTEMAIPNDPLAIFKAIATRKQEALKRGFKRDILETVIDSQYRYTEKKWSLQRHAGNIYELTHVSKGGCATEPTNESLAYSIRRVKIKKPPDKKHEEEQVLPGMYDFAEWITTKYGLETYLEQVLDSTKQAVYDRALSHEFGCIIEHNTDIQPSDWLQAAQYGMYRQLYGGTRIGLAKSYGIPLHAMRGDIDLITSMIMMNRDPLRATMLWM